MPAKVTVREPEGKQPIALSSLKPGDAFHFAEISFESAVTEDALYRVISDPSVKDGRVAMLSLDCKSILHRDGDRLVFPHNIEIIVSP